MSNLKSPLDGHLTDWEWEGPGLSIAAVTATNPKHTQTLRPPAPYNTQRSWSVFYTQWVLHGGVASD